MRGKGRRSVKAKLKKLLEVVSLIAKILLNVLQVLIVIKKLLGL